MSKYVGAATTLALFVVIAVAIYASFRSAPREPGLSVDILAFNQLPGWKESQGAWDGSLSAFKKSCAAIASRSETGAFAARAVEPEIRRLYGQNSHWQSVCALADGFSGQPRSFFEAHFSEPFKNLIRL